MKLALISRRPFIWLDVGGIIFPARLASKKNAIWLHAVDVCCAMQLAEKAVVRNG